MSATKSNALPRWVNTALVIAIGISLAVLSLKFLPQPAIGAVAVNTTTASGKRQIIDPVQQSKAIISTHLFGEVGAVAVKEEPVEDVQVTQITRLPLKLNGVFAYTPAEKAIAIISEGSSEQAAYWIGDKVTGETTLKEVHPEFVILSNRGKNEKLMLSEEAPIATRPIQRAQTQANNNNGATDPNQPVELPTNPRQLRDKLARNPALLGRVVAAEPYQENGKLLGYRITPKQNPEILEAQGIVAGDVITRVNNIQLNSQKQGIRALRNAVKADNLEVVVLRDGVEVPLSISLAQ